MVSEAALLTARSGHKKVGKEEIEEAVERVIAGTQKRSRVISEFEKKIVSFHEAGHALVGFLLPIPIGAQGFDHSARAGGGYTLMFPRKIAIS